LFDDFRDLVLAEGFGELLVYKTMDSQQLMKGLLFFIHYINNFGIMMIEFLVIFLIELLRPFSLDFDFPIG